MVKKAGQLQISFGMIFSIIIIIATIAVAFYVTSYFLKLGRCSEISAMYLDLQDDLDKAWSSPITRDIYNGKVSNSIEKICFGNLSSSEARVYRKEYENLKYFVKERANVFLYPSSKACGEALRYNNLDHVKIDKFFCTDVQKGNFRIRIEKDSSDALVRIGEYES